MYESVNWVIIGSGNGLSSMRRQAITWTNDDLLLTGQIETNFSEVGKNTNIFIGENTFDNIVCKTMASSFEP